MLVGGGQTCSRCGVVVDEAARFCVQCGGTLSATSTAGSLTDPLVGRRLGSGYVLKELIGVGGMGRVYRAEQDALGRTVAVKVIHPHLLDDERTLARFYREARAASRLNHPNSVSVIDFGRTDDGVLYLVMEHLDGKDLADILAHESMLPLPRVCRIIEQVLEALSEAHVIGVVHRDLKPENILLIPLRTGSDLVKVVDFGLATMTDHEPSKRISVAGSMCGTAEYMSPEQIRGAPVDARADLYSLGIVLFELLTGSPPFVAESPAKIIFRHLSDKIPDPREVVPVRAIPDELAEATLKAVARNPEDRWESADEMLAVMRGISARLGAGSSVRCRTCDAVNPTRTRFCGACGERLKRRTTVDGSTHAMQMRRGATSVPILEHGALLGREGEMKEVALARRDSLEAPVWLHVMGDAGIGKTRLLTEVARLSAAERDLVVTAGPHPTRAPVPYFAIRQLIARLLSMPDAALGELATPERGFDDPLARAGILEITEASGVQGVEDRSRVGAVAAALVEAIVIARAEKRAERVVLIVDDLSHCDASTARALAQLDRGAGPGTLIVTAARSRELPSAWVRPLPLMGLDAAASAQLFGAVGPLGGDARIAVRGSTTTSGRYLLPLYVEQVRALGARSLDDENVPARLADVISTRLMRLENEPTRLLQAVAVLGDRCPCAWLAEMVDSFENEDLEGLVEERFLRLRGEWVEIVHPFIRDLVLASTPSEARHDLHLRAMRLSIENGAPIEVRAEHAFGAGEAMGAMLVLERMGDLAIQRGDEGAAVTAYRRALDAARRELLETGDLLLEGAIITFSRKLGLALERAGDVSGAEGVLREAVDLTPPESLDRGRLVLALGLVEISRDRGRLAERLLKQALSIAVQRGESELEAQVWEALAKMRRVSSDLPGAAESLRRACDLYSRSAKSSRRRLRSLVELGRLLVESASNEERDEGARVSSEARRLAEELGSPALAAMALSNLARADVLQGNLESAEALYRDAARLAAEAGDADWYEKWVLAAREPSAA